MKTMFDAVTTANLPLGAFAIGVYVDGDFANEAAGRHRCPHALVLPITVHGRVGTPCVDCEAGDLTVAEAVRWVELSLAAGVFRPCVYASADTWESQGLLAALAKYGSRIRRWVAAFPGTGANIPAGYDAHQFSDANGVDTSLIADDFFVSAPKPAPKVDRWCAEIGVTVPEGSTGTLHFSGALVLKGGKWTVEGTHGNVKFSGPGGGDWAIEGVALNAKPLGK